MSWSCLPAEIRVLVFEALQQNGSGLAGFATVSREWQIIIEQQNFARIKLTPSCLADFGAMIYRNRALVRYIWLCLELPEYDCIQSILTKMSDTENALIATAFEDLFSTLSTWEPNGDLLLDISVHSPSDAQHYFKYLTFRPDTPYDEHDMDLRIKQSMLVKHDQRRHGWTAGTPYCPPREAFFKIFDNIMQKERCLDDPQEMWFRKLPLVPAVTGVLLRQQNYRRWKPTALAHMFSRLPRLQEIHYEPWREWDDRMQEWSDLLFQLLFKSLASSKLRRVTIFENFDQQYENLFDDKIHWNYEIDLRPNCVGMRIPTSGVSYAVAKASLKLEYLSASFIVDARLFFDACETSWEWPNMTSLALTSPLLTPHESPTKIDEMLQMAAAVAMKMPNLSSMEIWNGRKELAVLFRYQISEKGPAVLTWRGTWPFTLRPPVVQAWEEVALKRHDCRCVIVEELLDPAVVNSHGDAIHHLKLLNPVIRPVSFQQIWMEQRIRDGLQVSHDCCLNQQRKPCGHWRSDGPLVSPNCCLYERPTLQALVSQGS